MQGLTATSLWWFFFSIYMNTCPAGASSQMNLKSFTMVTIAPFSASKQTHCDLVVCYWMSDSSFTQHVKSGDRTVQLYMAGATWICCCLGTCSAYTIQPLTSLLCHFIQSYICMVYMCLAVTCHLQFWQNDWDVLRATAVTWGRTDTK